ncbi:lysylphosphatidylglycerol synthase transmembrane domain-containing protein [Albibacterium bauzanense]|uniref:Uncharacterized protein (TIRG00374 family) n=1 Tax=Albibacterium bauzanense TaxID=653929 RepID=A0A4V2PYF8_9SPHI|nr:lysylphosphatidylglycerol synthase transmembrane domain-containing protein [Albibacterium bauzanense]TCK85801.1 uncharacterized protein (TIRG00374 family) [Albibacterium bauzanense]
MKRWIVILITICIAASLIVFIQKTNLEEVINSLHTVGYKFIWLLIITGTAYIFGTISWRYCLEKKFRSISILRLFLIRHIGETVSLFNPTSIVAGDTVKAMLLGAHGIEKRKVITSVLLSRIILIISQLGLFLIAVIIIFLKAIAFSKIDSQERTAGLYPFILVKYKALRVKIVNLFSEILPMFKNNRRMLFMSILFALLHWLFGSLEFYFILKFLGVDVSILHALIIDLGVVFFKAAGAFIPGQIGVEEYGNKIMLMLVGIPDHEIWISASVLRRARQLVWAAFGISAYFLFFNRHSNFQKE